MRLAVNADRVEDKKMATHGARQKYVARRARDVCVD
jgi:hypothetical protein